MRRYTAFLVMGLLAAWAPAAKAGRAVSGRVLDKPGGRGVADVPVSMWHAGGERPRATRTDSDGGYAFRDVKPSRHEYVLRVGGRPVGVWVEGVAVRVSDKDVRVGDLFLKRLQSLSGSVRDTKGRPAAGAGINFSTADAPGNRDEVVTDDKGRFHLYVVPRQVQLYCGGTRYRYLPITPAREVTVKPGRHVRDVDFQVEGAPPFSGRALLPDGKPAAGVTVLAHVMWSADTVQEAKRIQEARMRREARIRAGKEPKPARRPPPFESWAREGGAGQDFRRKTDAQGRFGGYLRRPMASGRDEAINIFLVARLSDHSMGGMKVVKTTTLDPPPPPIELKLAPTGTAEFKVVDPDGKPVADAKPATISWLLGYICLSGTPAEAKPRFQALGSGRFRATGLVPGWSYAFHVQAKGYRGGEPLGVTVKPGQHRRAGTLKLKWWGKKAVPGLIAQLRSKDKYKRAAACRMLGSLGPVAADAVGGLIDLLKNDPVNWVRFQAAAALGKIGPAAKAAVPHLVRALQHDKLGVPRDAAGALGRIGPAARAAVPALIQALAEHGEADVRINSALSLALLEDPRAVPALKAALAQGNYHVREAALKALNRPAFRKADPSIAVLMKLTPVARDTPAMLLALQALQLPEGERAAWVVQEARRGRTRLRSVTGVLAVLTGRPLEQQFATVQELLSWWWQFPLDTPLPKAGKRDAAQLQALWEELAGEEGPGAYQAIRTMASGGSATVAFLAQRVKPISADGERIVLLIARLDSDKHAVRDKATGELARLGRAAEPALREAQKTKPSPEAAMRIGRLLEACGRPYPATPHARRVARAVRVLELIATRQAVKILRALANGRAGTAVTEQAKAALRRLSRGAGATTQTRESHKRSGHAQVPTPTCGSAGLAGSGGSGDDG